MENSNNIDDKEFEQISSTLHELKATALDESLIKIVEQVSLMNDLLRRIYALMSQGGPAPSLLSRPDSSDVSNPDEFWRIVDAHRSHLASIDKHLIAHDEHLAILGERIDLLVGRE